MREKKGKGEEKGEKEEKDEKIKNLITKVNEDKKNEEEYEEELKKFSYRSPKNDKKRLPLIPSVKKKLKEKLKRIRINGK